MRIAVAGKGGSGKTTISATMARLFAQRGFRVNALDDDPNPNLANALGLSANQVERLRGIARADIMEERVDAHNHASLHLTIPFEKVINDYGVVGPDGVRMLMMTALQGAGKG
ncbi:MAG: AAA family ATPase [Chloroflexota bacterium]|nr:AAA family ATPase [Chloroflexota bacterium]